MTSAIKPTQLGHQKYRADIDGLRAIAVLAVVGFHAFPGTIQGGFIGVDIFFVISGFLISSIIFSNLEHNRFSFVDFYSRRIKRIFPALLLVLFASLVFGWFALLADEYKLLGKHIAGGAGFISNFVLWRESGYFDSSAETKPLLHLWSLGIEEQFYIFWPLLLAFVWRRKWNFAGLTLAVAIISFAFNLYTIDTNPVAAFYSPVSRFWELMLGSLLAYISQHKPHLNNKFKNVQSLLGVVLLVLGLFFINKARMFPGWWALLPTLGAFLIISAGPQAIFNRRVLSNKVLVWFGLISFPLYLWHWPLLSIAHIFDGATTRGTRVLIVLTSVIFAWITYKFIERPIRFKTHGKLITVSLLALMLMVGSAGSVCYLKDGMDGLGYRLGEKSAYLRYFENSLPEQKYFQVTGMQEKFGFECDFYDTPKYRRGQATRIPLQKIDGSCYERDKRYKNAVFIWGDSHAQQLYFGLKKSLPDHWQILQVASSGCLADISATGPSTSDYCVQSNWLALKTIKETKPDVVIVAQNRGHSIENFEVIAKQLENLGIRKIIFTGPTPHWTPDLPKIIVRKLWENTPQRTMVGIDTKVLADNLKLQEQFQPTDTRKFANIISLFCNWAGCLTYLGDDKKYGVVTWDYGHLTPIASEFLARNLLVDLIIGNSGIRGQ